MSCDIVDVANLKEVGWHLINVISGDKETSLLVYKMTPFGGTFGSDVSQIVEAPSVCWFLALFISHVKTE